MPTVTFLSSTESVLSKTFTPKITIPYPHIYRFSSFSTEYRTTQELYILLQKHAKQGHCLLKGNPKTPLNDESRAGSTIASDPTDLLILDVDSIPGFNLERLLDRLPIQFKATSHITQYSASYRMGGDESLRAHLFYRLSKPVVPSVLKSWLIDLNLMNFREFIRLNRAATTLKWPIDITACQNDKLIYIAPPICKDGVEDPLTERILYSKGRQDTLDLELNNLIPDAIHQRQHELFNQLREQAGLPQRRKTTTKQIRGIPVMSNPGTAIVTGERKERGFVYLNLNGGDSWGYYYPENDPEVLYNFKGEPNYHIRTFLPDYFPAHRTAPVQPDANKLILAFLDRKTDSYFRGYYDYSTRHLDIHQTSSLQKLHDFLTENNTPIPEYIPTWDLSYTFDSDETIDEEARTINLFQKSIYWNEANDRCRSVPKRIMRVIRHVMGNDDTCIEAFLNWFAVIMQQRCMTLTAWVLSGTQGTGKGLLFHRILAPIIGERYTSTTQFVTFEKEFNLFAEQSLILLVDEVQVSDLTKRSVAMANIKRMITEPYIPIRRMHCDQYMVKNYLNFIFASNKHDPIEVDPEDRRFNIAPRQESKLITTMSQSDIDSVECELRDFAGYLLTRNADRSLAATPVLTAERHRLQELTRDTGEHVADKIKSGDLQFFIDNMPECEDRPAFELLTHTSNTPMYEDIIDECIRSQGAMMVLPRIYVEVLYYYTADKHYPTRHMFTKYANHKGLTFVAAHHAPSGKTVRGLTEIRWAVTPEMTAAWEARQHKTPPVTDASHSNPLRRVK